MIHRIRYGGASEIELEIPAEALVADYSEPAVERIADPFAAVRQALVEPFESPPLGDFVVPGDRVTVAIDPETPCAGPLVAGIVATLLDADVAADRISILLGQHHDLGAAWRSRVPDAARDVRVVHHDPSDRLNLCYLAATKDAEPILLSRLLCDADVVIPVDLVQPRDSWAYTGPHGGLCPSFSDTQTLQRFQTPNSMVTRRQQQRRREEASEVAWLLGAQFSVKVVAGAGDTLSHVLAGQDEKVSQQGQLLATAAWRYDAPQPAGLVIAAIERDTDQCTWTDVARALHAAQQAAETDGTIVLCTDLARSPGPALRRLAGLEDQERLLQRLGNDKSADAISAWALAEARDRHHVFLLSRLDESSVESLGIGFVDSPTRVNHFSERCRSCLLLGNAHRAVIQPSS